MTNDLTTRIQSIIGQPPAAIQPLSGGCIGDVYRVILSDGSSLVAKAADGTGTSLEPEG